MLFRSNVRVCQHDSRTMHGKRRNDGNPLHNMGIEMSEKGTSRRRFSGW